MNQAQAVMDRMHEAFVVVHLINGIRVEGYIETNQHFPQVEAADMLTIGSQPSYRIEGAGFYTLIPMRSVLRVQLDYE